MLSPPYVLTSRGSSSITMSISRSEAQSSVDAVRVTATRTAGQSASLLAVDAAATCAARVIVQWGRRGRG